MPAFVDRAPAGYFECPIAGCDLTVRLNLDIVERLGIAVIEGFKAVPRRGLEIGGLLLGRMEDSWVLVDDFLPVISEHKYGPSWLLSEKDKSFLATEIARITAEPGTHVLGLYRSNTRSDSKPTAEDQALVAAYCPGAASVFLLIKPEAKGAGSAAWFAAGHEPWNQSAAFPFVRRELSNGPYTVIETAPPAAAEPLPPRPEIVRLRMAKLLEAATARQAEILPPHPVSPNRHGWRWPAAVFLLSGVAGYLMAAWWAMKPAPRPQEPPPPVLQVAPQPQDSRPPALNVTLEHGSMHLRWDRDSPAVRHAAGAVVWIDDNARRQRLDLKPADLMEGSIQYWPSSSDVRFQLELLSSPRYSESIRATGIPLSGFTKREAPPPRAQKSRQGQK